MYTVCNAGFHKIVFKDTIYLDLIHTLLSYPPPPLSPAGLLPLPILSSVHVTHACVFTYTHMVLYIYKVFENAQTKNVIFIFQGLAYFLLFKILLLLLLYTCMYIMAGDTYATEHM